jgi:hypothetical protein
MIHIPGYLAVPILGCLYAAFPGALFTPLFSGLNTLSKITAAIFISIGFWICISWYISWVGLPLGMSSLIIQIISVFFFIAGRRLKFIGSFPLPLFITIRKIPLHYFILAIFVLLYCTPLLFITIPPGNDTAMHGYITRLIINNNGLPHSYRPILPVDYFGSYSAGYHVLTALVSGMNAAWLRDAINFVSVMVYPITLLGFIFLLQRFFTEKTAIYTALMFFGINTTIEGAIGWGGNSTVLSFGFCLFTSGLLVYAIQHKIRNVFYSAAFCLAAIPLIHAVPAITFAYILLPGYCILLYYYRRRFQWIILSSVALFICCLLLLTPFIVHFKSENSPELLLMIKKWQIEMMGNKLTDSFGSNLITTAGQVKYRIGDVLTIITGISLAVLIYFKKYKEIAVLFIFIVAIFVLIFNYAYWFLPLSELLYPERVVYFMIVCCAFFFACFLKTIEMPGNSGRIQKIHLYNFIVAVCLCISIGKVFTNYITSVRANTITCDKNTTAAFDWIDKNTEKNALFVASYADAGMWIPAFTNRATLGTHLHFIHHVKHIPDTLNSLHVPRYIFITKQDIQAKKEILSETKQRNKIFSNESVEIYH